MTREVDPTGQAMRGINNFWQQFDGDEIERNEHRGYVGGLWDELGQLQFDYLLDDGLKLIGALAFATIGPLTISSKAHLKPMPTWAHRGEGRR